MIAPTFGDMPYSLDAILPSPEDGIKGDIDIRCPTTGQPVPTGLHTGTVVFDTLPKIEMRMRCPACQKITGGTAPGFGSSKALNQVRTKRSL